MTHIILVLTATTPISFRWSWSVNADGTVKSAWFLTIKGAVQCYKCDRVVDPSDCQTVITCDPGHQCFTNKYITAEGHTFYNMDCKIDQVCTLLAKFGKRELEEVSPLSKRSSINLCSKCCSTGHCNQQLCSPVSPPIQYRKCYDCMDIEDLAACEKTSQCADDEECFAEIIYTDQGDIRHHLGCRSKKVCNILAGGNAPHGKRQQGTHLCNGCCTQDYCNIAGCMNITNVHSG